MAMLFRKRGGKEKRELAQEYSKSNTTNRITHITLQLEKNSIDSYDLENACPLQNSRMKSSLNSSKGLMCAKES